MTLYSVLAACLLAPSLAMPLRSGAYLATNGSTLEWIALQVDRSGTLGYFERLSVDRSAPGGYVADVEPIAVTWTRDRIAIRVAAGTRSERRCDGEVVVLGEGPGLRLDCHDGRGATRWYGRIAAGELPGAVAAFLESARVSAIGAAR